MARRISSTRPPARPRPCEAGPWRLGRRGAHRRSWPQAGLGAPARASGAVRRGGGGPPRWSRRRRPAQRLLEGRPAHDDLAVLVEDEALAVEDQLVLAATAFTSTIQHELSRARVASISSRCALADVEGRGRDVRDDVRAREREIGRRRPWLPDVLADGRPDERVPTAEQHETTPGLEVAVLVEDAVVGRKLLAVDRLHLAVDADGAGVEEVAVEMRRADERCMPFVADAISSSVPRRP